MIIAIDMVEIEEIGDNPRQIAAGDAKQTHHLNGCMVEVSIRNYAVCVGCRCELF